MEQYIKDSNRAFLKVVKTIILPRLADQSFKAINEYVDSHRPEIAELIRLELAFNGYPELL